MSKSIVIKNQDERQGDIKEKNVLFILVDDLGYSDIGAYNPNTFYETPNVDALARSGVMFTEGYAASPVCSPSRAAIMTGKHPTRLQATEWFHSHQYPHRVERYMPAESKDFMSEDEITLAEIYQANGYKTAFIGKWHLGEEKSQFPQNQGFDVNIAGTAYGYPIGGYFSPYKNPSIEDGPDGEYLTDRLTNEAVSLIRDYANQDDPFLLYLSFYTVHTPLQAPGVDIEKYQAKREGSSTKGNDFAQEQQYFVSEDTPRKVRIRQNHPTYAAMVENMDRNVGRVLSALDEAGLTNDTVVVFTSDNGGLSTSEGLPTSNLPLRGGKGWLYEGGIKVPFIVRAPDQQITGLQTSQLAVGMDFIPTLASLTFITLPELTHMDGVDLTPAMRSDTNVPNERALFWHYPHYSNQGGFPGAAVRKGNYKLLQNFEDGSLQLYNLEDDINEKTDIKDKHPDKLAELKSLLNEWYVETDARFLRRKTNINSPEPWKPISSVPTFGP
jgi:arylsulfatase A-like enzyme